jgi:hypothetical protein
MAGAPTGMDSRAPRRAGRTNGCAPFAFGHTGQSVDGVSTPEPPSRPPTPAQPPTEPLNRPVPPQQPRAPIQQPAPAYAYDRVPPEGLPPDRWWDNSGVAVAAAIIALLVGGVVGYLIGHESESEHRGVPRTVTSTATVVRPKTVVQTHTVTASTVKETPSPANQANEARLTEAETNLRKSEKENQELKRQIEEAGRSP